MARPKALRFAGKNDPNGYHFAGVPARDLTAADIANLSDAQLADITGGDTPLYVPIEKDEPQPERAKPAEKKA